MHGCITAVVPNSQIHAELFEKIHTYWLVTLSSNMYNIDTHVV